MTQALGDWLRANDLGEFEALFVENEFGGLPTGIRSQRLSQFVGRCAECLTDRECEYDQADDFRPETRTR